MSEAPPPSQAVDICNLALARLGQTVEITDIVDPVGKAAILCARHYPMTRRRLLRGPRVFNFAKERVQLTTNELITPAFGFASVFDLPNDFLRFLTLGDIDANDPRLPTLYDIRGKRIYTDETDESDTLNLSYIKDETNVSVWDAIFVNLMRLELAMDMAVGFTLKTSAVRDLNEELKDVRLEAGAVSGQESPPRRITRSKWVTNRRLGGGGDTTRHSI